MSPTHLPLQTCRTRGGRSSASQGPPLAIRARCLSDRTCNGRHHLRSCCPLETLVSPSPHHQLSSLTYHRVPAGSLYSSHSFVHSHATPRSALTCSASDNDPLPRQALRSVPAFLQRCKPLTTRCRLVQTTSL